jgi:hypothetical protein
VILLILPVNRVSGPKPIPSATGGLIVDADVGCLVRREDVHPVAPAGER